MRGWWTLAALLGCNQVYSLDHTKRVDALAVDAPPPFCNTDVLSFSPLIEQTIVANCHHYTTYNGHAVALCSFVINHAMRTLVGEGATDQPMAPAAIALQPGNTGFLSPRLSPEGDLFVLQATGVTPTVARLASVYARVGTSWQWQRNLPFTFTTEPYQVIGAPSRGPGRHLFITRLSSIDEAIDNGDGTWTMVPYTPGDFGVDKVAGTLALSPDGLRVVFPGLRGGESGVYFATRTSIDIKFDGATRIDVPYVVDPFLLEDCSRLYFTGIGSVFFARQR